jgi:kynureninase
MLLAKKEHSMHTRTDAAYAAELDAADALAHFRERFVDSDPELIYLDGNSLGRLPQATATLAAEVVQHQWGNRLIRGWNDGWFTLPERIGAKVAQLIGAAADEVVMADSTSINLFKLLVAALRDRPGKTRIITDSLNFPSDLYILQGAVDLLGNQHQIEMIDSSDGIHGPAEAIIAALDQDVALVTLTHTLFKSGYIYDMAAITAAAHAAGALVLWDLSHSVGSVPVQLNASNADLAIGCGYKYLNGGPGAPAFLYVRRDLQARLKNPLTGWMGQRDLFDFAPQYAPAAGLRHFLTGTPAVISLALMEPGLDLLIEAGMPALREKSIRQTSYLTDLWRELLAPVGYRLNSPADANWRGSHVSFGHEHGLGIDLAMINDLKLLPDFRPPDNIRIGLAPLYTRYQDIYTTVIGMRRIIEERLYEPYLDRAPIVT